VLDRDELERQAAALEGDLEAAAAEARSAEETLERLKQSQSETVGRLTLASRAEADLRQRLGEVRTALRDAAREAAEQALRQAVTVRDAAAKEAATAINRTIGKLENLDAAREAVQQAADEVTQAGARGAPPVPEEPASLVEQWSRLEQLVREHVQWRLEEDLIEAAASSAMGHAIEDLPIHLQQLARERRRAKQRADG
jgi:soluble lytic murein transglycosylase-like protein